MSSSYSSNQTRRPRLLSDVARGRATYDLSSLAWLMKTRARLIDLFARPLMMTFFILVSILVREDHSGKLFHSFSRAHRQPVRATTRWIQIHPNCKRVSIRT